MTIAAIQAQGASAARLLRTRVEMGVVSGGRRADPPVEYLAQMHNLFDVNWSESGLNYENSELSRVTWSPAGGLIWYDRSIA